MENQTQTDKTKNKSTPKWLQLALLASGVILIVIGLVRIFSGSKETAVSDAFISKFNEFQGPSAQIRDDLKNVSDLLNGIAAKEQTKDYAGAATDLQTALVKLNDADSVIKSLTSLTSEFQDMVNDVSGQNIKTAGLHFIDVSNSRNTAVLKMIGDAEQLIKPNIAYYDGLAHGKMVKLDEPKLAVIAGQLTADAQSVAKIKTELDSATQDLAQAAGFELTKK